MISVPDHIVAFKDLKTEDEFQYVKPRLQAFILAAGSYMYFRFGVTIVVTDLLRLDKKSTHAWGNGVDFRARDLTEEQGDALREFLKWQFPYYMKLPMPNKPKYSIRDERKPESSEHWTGPHIHGEVNWREDN